MTNTHDAIPGAYPYARGRGDPAGAPRVSPPTLPLDLTSARAQYLAQNELAFFEGLVAPEPLAAMQAEALAALPHAQRKLVPGYKNSGSVSYHHLLEHAPAIVGFYRSPALLALVEQLVGASLVVCPEDDPHACALYFYTEPGDHIGFHYDTSHYRGARYTVLVGLVDDSSSRLVCFPWKRDPARAHEELRLATRPGSFVVFNGDNIYHSVSPLGLGEQRIMLTLEYVTDPTMTSLRRAVSNLKDAMTYFGFGAMLREAKKRRQRAR